MYGGDDRNRIEESLIDAAACRKLACAVINEQFEIACKTGPAYQITDKDIRDARKWFRSRDFATWCDLIGLDPAFVRDGVAREVARIEALHAADGGR